MARSKKKMWAAFQAQFIELQADLHKWQKMSRQGGYKADDLVVIEEAFTNLDQATAEERVTVTNLTDANLYLTDQVS